MARLKPVKHDEHLSLVDHLDELRTRIIYSLVFLAAAFAVCFWQSDVILDVAAAPAGGAQGPGRAGPDRSFHDHGDRLCLRGDHRLGPLHQLSGLRLHPAGLLPRERRAILPMLFTIPLLFLVGCVFAYFVVLPAAINFLLSFNGEQFAIQLRAREYYSFFSMTLLAGGVVFELPIVILALVRLRILTVDQLRQNRRYAYLICAVIAAALPGVDPISMLIETVPLLVLYELSILLARGIGQPKESAESQIPSIQEN